MDINCPFALFCISPHGAEVWLTSNSILPAAASQVLGLQAFAITLGRTLFKRLFPKGVYYLGYQRLTLSLEEEEPFLQLVIKYLGSIILGVV